MDIATDKKGTCELHVTLRLVHKFVLVTPFSPTSARKTNHISRMQESRQGRVIEGVREERQGMYQRTRTFASDGGGP